MPDPLEVLVARLLELATVDEPTGRRRLPPERELGEALGMSRGALREQLAVLERLGFLHRTQGRGTYIESPSIDFVRSYFSISRALGHVSDEEFAESRVLIEEALAATAARRATPQQIATLRADIADLVAAVDAGDERAAHEADLSFHRHLERAVGNPVLGLVHAGLSHVFVADVAARCQRTARRRQTVDAGEPGLEHLRGQVHHEIVDAIEAGDPERARLAMRRHFGVVAGTAGS